MEVRDALYIIFGYLLGSILFARLGGLIFKKTDIMAESPDKNPGTMNAFTYGGFRCGVFTLCGDLFKGFLPVFLYRSGELPENPLMLSFVMAAPVLGHILPFYDIKHGGKGIAATFGCFLGLLPHWTSPVSGSSDPRRGFHYGKKRSSLWHGSFPHHDGRLRMLR